MSQRNQNRQAIKKIARMSNTGLKCDGCVQCCKDSQLVVLQPELGDKEEDYPKLDIRYTDKMLVCLPLKENGDCYYLIDDKCSIYNKRPSVCRAFDCRREALAFKDPKLRAEGIEHNVFNAEIFAEGDKRLHTLKLLPEEEAFWKGEHPRGMLELAKSGKGLLLKSTREL